MVKLIVMYGHPSSAEEFEKYYAETHLPIAGKIPGVQKVELTKCIGTPEGSPPSQYRIAEVYFNDLQGLEAGMGSAEGQAAVADIPNFATGGVDVMIGEC